MVHSHKRRSVGPTPPPPQRKSGRAPPEKSRLHACSHLYASNAPLALRSSSPSVVEFGLALPHILHVYAPAACLKTSQSSIPPRRDTCNAPPEPQSSIPYIHTHTPAVRLQTPEFLTSMLPRPMSATCLQSSSTPYLYTFTSARLQYASRASCAHDSAPPRCYTCSAS